jgi:spore coat protein SA
LRSHGPLPHRETTDWFSAADIFFLPTRAESFGIVVAEAMGASLPVVASGVAAIPELIVDGVTGFLVDANDVRAMATALERLIDSPMLRQAMGEAGRRRVAEHFTWQMTAQRHRAHYADLVRATSHSEITRLPPRRSAP